MRKIAKIIIMLGVVLGAAILGWLMRDQAVQDQSATNRICDVGPLLERIHTLSSLTTLRIDVADAVVTELLGKTGGISAVLVMHGEATLAVDLTQAKFQSIDLTSRTAVLLLPQPHVQIVKLDHRKTKVICLSTSGLWLIVPGGDRADAAISDLAYRRGEEIVATAAADPELAQQARTQAERVIRSLFGPIVWNVQVQWRG